MRCVRDILKKKGADVVSMAPDETVYAMLELMAKHNIGAVLVFDGITLAGIVSERDYARSVILKGRSSKEMAVREIMSSPVLVVAPTDRVQACMTLMTEKRVRHLPVVENAQVIGVISIGDVVKEIMTEQESLIADLESYIGPTR